MNEVQGPTPAGTSRPYRSLAEALRAHRVPEENHEFIAAIVDAVGVTTFIDRGRYIEAIRRGEGAPLHIGKTYTNGFTEDERITVGGAPLRLQPSEGRAPYFYVAHPSTYPASPARPKRTAGARAASASKPAEPRTPRIPKPVERDYGVCGVCFMVRNAAGNCGCD
ncbi:MULTISPECIES: hypothetical protein [Microbacterium]|uniref:hypothetical protein n=1 Tax=Microbacterium TaxID=33882 RepID=UPI00217E0414|nr:MULTISPECIES: hypothetical protein [Microbacterium]UWF77943.1 hypothetical protein JSY13_02485 [Microbacterium neungamense]WCM56120.1 hypothetical protein JRG78_02530 [Microbacterium sp. EF45047]